MIRWEQCRLGRTEAPSLYAMVIFFGVCSGVVFGNATVSTPFSIEALISSGYKLFISMRSTSQILIKVYTP